MRISDWSSDVCSSDLGHLPIEVSAALLPNAAAFVGPDIQRRALRLRPIGREQGRRGRSRANPPGANRARVSAPASAPRSEEHTSELQSLMRISYAVFCLKKKNKRSRKLQRKTQ